jgi:hypothetical protein
MFSTSKKITIAQAQDPKTKATGFTFKYEDGITYGPWYVNVGDYYLCTDGSLAGGCWKVDCRRNVIQHGYYRTRESARAAVRRYKAKLKTAVLVNV